MVIKARKNGTGTPSHFSELETCLGYELRQNLWIPDRVYSEKCDGVPVPFFSALIVDNWGTGIDQIRLKTNELCPRSGESDVIHVQDKFRARNIWTQRTWRSWASDVVIVQDHFDLSNRDSRHTEWRGEIWSIWRGIEPDFLQIDQIHSESWCWVFNEHNFSVKSVTTLWWG